MANYSITRLRRVSLPNLTRSSSVGEASGLPQNVSGMLAQQFRKTRNSLHTAQVQRELRISQLSNGILGTHPAKMVVPGMKHARARRHTITYGSLSAGTGETPPSCTSWRTSNRRRQSLPCGACGTTVASPTMPNVQSCPVGAPGAFGQTRSMLADSAECCGGCHPRRWSEERLVDEVDPTSSNMTMQTRNGSKEYQVTSKDPTHADAEPSISEEVVDDFRIGSRSRQEEVQWLNRTWADLGINMEFEIPKVEVAKDPECDEGMVVCISSGCPLSFDVMQAQLEDLDLRVSKVDFSRKMRHFEFRVSPATPSTEDPDTTGVTSTLSAEVLRRSISQGLNAYHPMMGTSLNACVLPDALKGQVATCLKKCVGAAACPGSAQLFWLQTKGAQSRLSITTSAHAGVLSGVQELMCHHGVRLLAGSMNLSGPVLKGTLTCSARGEAVSGDLQGELKEQLLDVLKCAPEPLSNCGMAEKLLSPVLGMQQKAR
mmetsp:Transcript_1319/g.2726  ORF Transcript_1319/g.2726 Transcript_1319/m.2726 type:complete len:487 (+) Transcript_1319:318-1778(+)|eukprot:CAMPEP_0114246052 /NCGR_PEP_ID=MMETSP0058-20121206/12242_1 /TAXON_ID=36894 /ORGANISM="Pyramimonas parkeae, CCMP726" /LENGTH=486 /DNA_ID=CAMNT_0001359183 /DNA_START=265 /DNA_END=1725 /DNA_ORIENTATION=-